MKIEGPKFASPKNERMEIKMLEKIMSEKRVCRKVSVWKKECVEI